MKPFPDTPVHRWHLIPFEEREAIRKWRNEAFEAGRPQWISATERMPEPHEGKVLVLVRPTFARMPGIDLDTWDEQTGWSQYLYQDVSHWMPLPEPPKA